MQCPSRYSLIITACALLSLNVASDETATTDKLSCSAKHLDSNQLVDVKTVSGITGGQSSHCPMALGLPNHSD